MSIDEEETTWNTRLIMPDIAKIGLNSQVTIIRYISISDDAAV